MKLYGLSLGVGLLVGLIYGLLGVRSPAPPLVALVGLLGILVGEQAIPAGTQWLARTGFASAFAKAHVDNNPSGQASGPQQGARQAQPAQEKHS